MAPETIKKSVEDFPKLLIKKEKLQKRLIQVSGKDFEQEMAITQRLESVEQLIELIDNSVFGDEILT
ncbi:MAG: hypothetical protein Q8934_14235 [Bacillota bacterium]|nr:hypothetical protein [Bacillota bacterium]